jgi:hypothetical protein
MWSAKFIDIPIAMHKNIFFLVVGRIQVKTISVAAKTTVITLTTNDSCSGNQQQP